jgi:cytochrome c-type biogenesis protein CcmH/NrfG
VALWLAMLLLTASVALFVAAPLTEVLTARKRIGATADVARLEHERGLALAAIRELEFDHAMGKIADADFQTMRSRLEGRALTAMSALANVRNPSPKAPDLTAPA